MSWSQVGERVFFPDREPLAAESDFVEAKAFASVICNSVPAFLSFAKAAAEAIIREHSSVAKVLADALVERGTLYGEQIDQIISNAVAAEELAKKGERRENWLCTVNRANGFRAEKCP